MTQTLTANFAEYTRARWAENPTPENQQNVDAAQRVEAIMDLYIDPATSDLASAIIPALVMDPVASADTILILMTVLRRAERTRLRAAEIAERMGDDAAKIVQDVVDRANAEARGQ